MQKIRLGEDSEGPYELAEFSGDKLPFEIGSLERHALTYLGDWRKFQQRGEHFGFYYRMGIKQGVMDADGDPATVFLHFVAPFTKEGHAMTPQVQATIDKGLVRLIQTTTVAFSQVTGNAVGVRAQPTEYMVRELVTLLPK